MHSIVEKIMRVQPIFNHSTIFLISTQVDKGMRDVLEIEELFDCKTAVNASFHFSKDKSQVCNWDKMSRIVSCNTTATFILSHFFYSKIQN